MKYPRFLAFIIPASFFFLSYVYQDSFYLLLTGVTFLFALFIILPKFLSNKQIPFMLIKNHIQKSNNRVKVHIVDVFKISIKSHETLIFILMSVLVFIIFFSFTGVNILMIPTAKNFILEYYISQFLNLKQVWIYLIGLLIGLSWIGSNFKPIGRVNKFTFKFNRLLLIKHIVLTCIALVCAFFISFLSVYVYGIIKVNIAVLQLKTSPSSVGVIYGKDAINSKLKSITTAPQVIGTDNNNPSNAILSVVVNDGSIRNNYFQERIIKTIPHFLIIPFNITNKSVVMVKNTIVISSIDKDIMQTISPTLARLLLKNYFKNHNFKSDPTITILNRQEYLAFRQDEINQQVAKILVLVKEEEDYINGLYGTISNAKQKISANQSAIQNASSQKDYYYNLCNENNSAGYYFYGVFYHTYIHRDCEAGKSQWDQDIAQYQKNISDWNNTLYVAQNNLSDAQTIEQYYKDYAQSVDATKESTPQELGIFEGPSHVRVVLDSTNPKGIDAFLETLVHENLHYQSYVSEDRYFQFTDETYDGFWEEGLTEYFARKVIASNLGININQGYPLIVRIVGQIAKKIPESELQRIYFTKDGSSLEANLDGAYGNNFYKDTEQYFKFLSYFPPDKQLKIANNIMTRIKGKQLTSNDLYSTDLQQE